MVAATLAPCLVQLRAEINLIAPNRDKTSDGWIGDPAHAARKSDHNKDPKTGIVHAYDGDEDLRESDLTMEKIVQHILRRSRLGLENRLTYIIYERRIWEAKNGWRQRTYTGSNAHDKHAHFSCSYVVSRERSMASWKLEDIEVALTNSDKAYIDEQFEKAVSSTVERVWKKLLNIQTDSSKPADLEQAGSILRYTSEEHHRIERKIDELARKIDDLPQG